MIRWKAVIPTLVALHAFFLLIFFFLDPFAKWVLVKAGQGVFGARVSVDSVNWSLRHSSLRIRDMEVADKSEPMKNLFQFDEAAFALRALPLLEKKVIIDEASLTGLKFGTPRKTSGALPFVEKKPGFVGKAVDRLWSQVETVSLQKLEGAKQYYDPKTVVNPEKLTTLKTANKVKEQIQKTPEDLQKQIDQLNATPRTQALQKRVQALGQGGNDPSAILQKAAEAKAIQSDLQALKNDVTSAQRNVTEKIQAAQGLIEDVKKAKDEDWQNLRATLSLPSLDKESISRAVFGPASVQWMERILSGIHTSRQYMPAKPQKPPPPPRGRGRTIEFPREDILPRFLLVRAELSGEVGQAQPLGFSGTLAGLTTNPPLYGKPMTLKLQGSQGGRSLDVKATVDHSRDVPFESVKAVYDGFSLSNLSFGQAGSMALGLRQGTGRVRAAFTFRGDDLTGQADVEGSGLVIDPHIDFHSSSAIAQRAAQNVTASLAAVKSLKVGVLASGTLASSSFSVESNIGDILTSALKNALGSEIAEQEKALRAELDRQTEGKIRELQGLLSGLSQKYLSQLGAGNQAIDQLLNQVKNQAIKSVPGVKPLDSFKDLFGR